MSKQWTGRVVAVEHGTGVPAAEVGWTKTCAHFSTSNAEAAQLTARVLALKWWDDTDQSGKCRVVMHLTAPDGTLYAVEVDLEVQVWATPGRARRIKRETAAAPAGEGGAA